MWTSLRVRQNLKRHLGLASLNKLLEVTTFQAHIAEYTILLVYEVCRRIKLDQLSLIQDDKPVVINDLERLE